jgi:hypothetical protein
MTRREYLSLVAGVALAPAVARGKHDEAFVVIVHPSNRFDALSRSKLTFLFLRKVSRWPWGAEVFPIDVAANRSMRREFTEQVLRTTEEKLAEYWIDQRATRGVSPPMQVPGGTAAKSLVAGRPGAIAYITASELDGTVKAIRVDP